jgi:four helix bundle protein
MAVERYQDLDTWQLTEAFKREVFKLVIRSAKASRDFRFRDQTVSAGRGPSKHVCEGFLRFSAAEFCRYLDYAISSLAEAESHVRDGIDLEYFTAESCEPALRLARRCSKAIMSLKRSQQRYLEAERNRRRHKPPD